MTSLPSPPPLPDPLSTASAPLTSLYTVGNKMVAVAPISDEPPTYSPSAATPSYSVEPGPSERTLAATARLCRRSRTGVFVRKNSLITIALRGQDEHAPSPSYGRNGKISGDVGLSCTHDVQSVYIVVRTHFSLSPTAMERPLIVRLLKLEGRFLLASPECASTDGTFFSAEYDIWKRSDEDADGAGPCPSMLPFEVVLPETFTDRGVRRALPPSYEIDPYVADIRVKFSYSIRVVVQRKGSKLAIWKLPKK